MVAEDGGVPVQNANKVGKCQENRRERQKIIESTAPINYCRYNNLNEDFRILGVNRKTECIETTIKFIHGSSINTKDMKKNEEHIIQLMTSILPIASMQDDTC
jgi:hypothetical protein|eukprot:scaffold197_cov268-Chaetoceros_neogracile.AAC.46